MSLFKTIIGGVAGSIIGGITGGSSGPTGLPPRRPPLDEDRYSPIRELMEKELRGQDPFGKEKEKEREWAQVPDMGSPVWCHLGGSYLNHSGIYIGCGKIVELQGNGRIAEVTLREFLSNVTTWSDEIFFAATEDGTRALGSMRVARRALDMRDQSTDYNLVLNNCHQFTSGCLSGDFRNADTAFTFLEMTTRDELNGGDQIRWVKWKWR